MNVEDAKEQTRAQYDPILRLQRNGNPYLVDDPCALVFLQSCLHLGKRVEHCLSLFDLLLVIAKELEGSLEHLAGLVEPAPLLLELAPLHPDPWLRADGDPPLIDGTRAVELLVALLHLDVRLPRLVVGLPLHPALEDLAGSWDVLEELLEVDILVPELVHTGEEGDGAVKKIAGMLDVAAFKLDFGV